MRLGFDFRVVGCGRIALNRGIGRYTQQQLREFLRLGTSDEVVLLLPHGYDGSLLPPEVQAAPGLVRYELPRGLSTRRRPGQTEESLLQQAAEFSAILEDLDLDLYHATTPVTDMDPPFWRSDTCAVVANHFDLIPWIYAEHFFAADSPVERQRYMRTVRAFRHADRLLAISSFVRDEAFRLLGIPTERIEVGYPVADPVFQPLPGADAELRLAGLEDRFALGNDYLLTVTHSHYAKNLPTLLHAFAAMPADWRRRHRLVLVDDIIEPDLVALGRLTRELGIHEDTLPVGFVTEEELVALYSAAYAYVHPSRYEGFGLPVLEAMQCGAPVIAARAGALPEVLAGAGLLVEAEAPESFVAAFQRLDDGGLRAELGAAGKERAAQFSPRQLGEATSRCYERALAESTVARWQPAARPRLAVWSPLPPQASGVSDYTAELLEGMDAWAEVELFVDDAVLPDPELLDRWPIFHYSAFERRQRWRSFELPIYQLGASTFHLYMLEAIERWPGILVAHDLTISYLQMEIARHGLPAEEIQRMLLEHDGLGAVVDHQAIAPLDGQARTAATAHFLDAHPMTKQLFAASRAIITHLPRVEAELDGQFPGLPVYAFPMGVEDPWRSVGACDVSEFRRRFGVRSDAFVVGVFGIADPVKHIETVLGAVARLASRVPQIEIIVVGRFTSQQYRTHLENLATDLGIAPRLRFFGQVPKPHFNQLLLCCDVVANLRDASRRQMSATLVRAAAAGKPVAVNALADWEHLAPSFCYRLPTDATGEVDALADWLETLQDPARLLATSSAAREYYLQHSTIGRLAENYRKVVASLTSLPRQLEAPSHAKVAPLGDSKACEIEDFQDSELGALIRDIYPHLSQSSPAFPAGYEDRKHWESAMSVRALGRHGALRPDARLLGVGAGSELTSFYLTKHVREVVATDLYLDPGTWSREATVVMLTHPQTLCPFPFDVSRLTVRHMDGRALDFPADSFAGIYSSGSIEHFGELKDVAAAAYEMGRVLEVGGVATLSTEFLINGPPGSWGWPGVLLLSRDQLLRYVVEASGLELCGDLDTSVSAATLRTRRDLVLTVKEIEDGHRALPHLVLSHARQTFGSIHLTLRKTAAYPVSNNAWAAPSEHDRATIASAATAAAHRLQDLVRNQVTEGTAIAPSPDSSTTTWTPVEKAFAAWDAIRARSALQASRHGSLWSRGLGFLQRAGRRVRDLGVAWDRERDLLQAMLAEISTLRAESHELAHRLASVERLPVELREFDERLTETGQRQLALLSRLGALAVRQEAIEQGLLAHSRGLLTIEELLRQPHEDESRITPTTTSALLAALDRDVSMLHQAGALEVSTDEPSLREELQRAAEGQFGLRLSSAGANYRFPNDAWLHLNLRRGGQHSILLEVALARLKHGGYFLLATRTPTTGHALLRMVEERDVSTLLGKDARLLIWQKR